MLLDHKIHNKPTERHPILIYVAAHSSVYILLARHETSIWSYKDEVVKCKFNTYRYDCKGRYDQIIINLSIQVYTLNILEYTVPYMVTGKDLLWIEGLGGCLDK